MNTLALLLAAGLAGPAADPLAPEPPAALPATPVVPVLAAPPEAYVAPPASYSEVLSGEPARGRFESDHAFDSFTNPISNPVLAKDPRSNTWARFLFVNNNFPGSQAFQGGNAQVYALQLNVALTERLSIIAEKDGIANVAPRVGAQSTGLLNLAAGLKYTFYRDVEGQGLAAVGLQYEAPSGEASVFQNHGSGNFTPFITYGKRFGCDWHLLGTHGFQFGADFDQEASFFYHSLHIDRRLGWFVPLAELNWFQYTTQGNRLPAVVGEGDGLLNLGTLGVAGKNLVSLAVGGKAVLSQNLWLGTAYEFGVTDYKGILNNRITVEAVLRY